jgi:hypothetical protein
MSGRSRGRTASDSAESPLAPVVWARALGGHRRHEVLAPALGLYHFAGTAPNVVTRQADTHGVLQLTLTDGTYAWRLAPVDGRMYTGSGALGCR